MNKSGLLNEVVSLYLKHGWQLRRALLKPETRAELSKDLESLNESDIKDSEVDAVWFSRLSHGQREAWELRLLAESQYALFETFEADETEEERDDVRLEMEARLREYANR